MSDLEQTPSRRRPRSRRFIVGLICGLVVIGGAAVRPIAHLVSTAFRDVDQLSPLPPGVIDDAPVG